MSKKIFYRLFFITFTVFVLGSCYQMNEPDSGDLFLNVTAPAKAVEDETVWVVCLVVDAAFEDQFIEMLRLYDKNDFTDIDSYEDDADEILEDMLTKGALRFDGGRFFYQFKMQYSGGNTGEFTIPGIPADKDYFLYVMVFDSEITSIDDIEDEEADVYMEMHYYDPAYYTGGHDGVPDTVGKGWYYFTEWNYAEISGNPAISPDTYIWEKNSIKVSNQPFTVEAGEETSLDILLVEDPEEILILE